MSMNCNEIPLFQMNDKIDLNTNFAECILHFSNVVEILADKEAINNNAYLELYTHLKNLKEQKWFLRQTNHAEYVRRYVRPKGNNVKEFNKHPNSFCKYCVHHYSNIYEHRHTKKHKLNKLNYDFNKRASTNHHSVIKNYKVGKVYSNKDDRKLLILHQIVDGYLEDKISRHKNSIKIQFKFN